MTEEDKKILKADLCARLPYGVKIKTPRGIYTVDAVSSEGLFSISNEDKTLDDLTPHDGHYWLPITGDYKPYLRPMSSMMQGEWEEMTGLIYPYGKVNRNLDNDELSLWLSAEGNDMPIILMDNVFAWLNKKMFDYHGLIPMGLALPAPKRMYKRKIK